MFSLGAKEPALLPSISSSSVIRFTYSSDQVPATSAYVTSAARAAVVRPRAMTPASSSAGSLFHFLMGIIPPKYSAHDSGG